MPLWERLQRVSQRVPSRGKIAVMSADARGPVTIRRPVARIDRSQQKPLFESLPEPEASPAPSRPRPMAFIEPDPNELCVGNTGLKTHLKQMGIREPFVVRDLLSEIDFDPFKAAYPGGGRAAYGPREMIGILLYGIMQGVTSLRQLERFARVDLGCWWISGGITPDHSILGRFVQRHETLISDVLFGDVVVTTLKWTETTADDLAGDGTVIEAMSSRFGLLTKEALQDRRAELAEKTDPESIAERTQLDELDAELSERRAQGRKDSFGTGHPLEPDASVLKQKRGGFRPSYAPTILANEARIVVDAEIAPGYELKAMVALMRRAEAERVSLDNGFLAREVMDAALASDIDALIATRGERASKTDKAEDSSESKRFTRSDFYYDELRDLYICPAGEELIRVTHSGEGVEGDGYDRYGTKACFECPQRSRCTEGKQRFIERRRSTVLREAMEQVMRQRGARGRYALHKSWVEPVFSVLRQNQGLNRFRRRGLRKVRLEFRMHLMAYNLSRVVAKIRALGGFVGAVSGLIWAISRLQGRFRTLVAEIRIHPVLATATVR